MITESMNFILCSTLHDFLENQFLIGYFPICMRMISTFCMKLCILYACCMKNAVFIIQHIYLHFLDSCYHYKLLGGRCWKSSAALPFIFLHALGIFAWNFHLYISLYLHDLYARMARMWHVVHFSIPSSFPFYDLSISTVLLSCMLWRMLNNILHAHTPHFLALRGGFSKKIVLVLLSLFLLNCTLLHDACSSARLIFVIVYKNNSC